MHCSLFLRIQYVVEAHDPYFVQKINAIGILGLSSLQKITTAMRMLAYGIVTDYVDEYMRIGESTAIESLKNFVQAIVAIFSDEYLRPPNDNDIARLLAVGENCGFPEILGSIDSTINSNDYGMGHYLADGIYPQWSIFVKIVSSPQGNKQKYFTTTQESARNDVEHAFGVLQARFAIVGGPARFWKYETLKEFILAFLPSGRSNSMKVPCEPSSSPRFIESGVEGQDEPEIVVFSAIQPDPTQILVQAQKIVEESIQSSTHVERLSDKSLHSRQTSNQHWSPPPFGWIKDNSDGATSLNGELAGFGVIARDHRGTIIAGHIQAIQGGSLLISKAVALHNALSLVVESGWTPHVEFVSDAETLVKIIHNPENSCPLEIASVVKDIRRQFV
ncbi:hypothetical protein HHK36_018083 [Tetracentron sinense]|uniref:RNase H type-1 domain-containing protein n=1 Tax=Tetracentron sinense TaxID=13715 RepID=A0A834Z0T5_TETSI|nr:hypothetical protein HHK36_018083 [Tetracentron sinense]